MSSDPHSNARRGPMLAIALLSGTLVIGGVFVGRSLFTGGSSSGGSDVAGGVGQGAQARDSVLAIEAGLASAAEYQRTGKFAEASTILGRLAEQAPSDRTVRLAYAQALLGLKRYEEALKQFDSAIALSGVSSGGAVPQKRDAVLAQMHFEAGTCANAAGMIDKAMAYYETAQALDTAEPRYPVFLAMVQIRAGQDAAAMASLVRAIKLNPDMAEAWGTMAELEFKSNRLQLARQHLERARTLQPEVSRWRILEARILNRQGDPETAATIIQGLPPGERADRGVMALLAESFGMLRQPAQAAAVYERAFEAAPTDAELAYLAATWYQRAGEGDRAHALARTASMLGHAGAKGMLSAIETGR